MQGVPLRHILSSEINYGIIRRKLVFSGTKQGTRASEEEKCEENRRVFMQTKDRCGIIEGEADCRTQSVRKNERKGGGRACRTDMKTIF